MKAVQQLHQDTFAMPKIELHAHIGGCFRPQTFLELVEAKGADLDKVDFYKVTTEVSFEFFKVGSKLVTDIATLQRVVYEIIEDYSKQNCKYLELRSTPKAFAGSSIKSYAEAVIEAIKEAEQDFEIKVRYLVSINRNAGVETA